MAPNATSAAAPWPAGEPVHPTAGSTGPASAEQVIYERYPGAAIPSKAAVERFGYHRRRPEKTPLYRIVQGSLETFLEQARLGTDGIGYPRFIEREFRRYLGCGILANGFARLRCPDCGHERLLAFSCKGRLCPSCLGRRMSELAAFLADHLLPRAPYRQWVMSYPWPLRLRLAMDRKFLTAMTTTFLRTIFAFQRLRGRQLGIAPGQTGQTGSVTFLQRAGGALSVNPHGHAIVPDGLFVPSGPGPDAPLQFVPLPPPTQDDIEFLTHRLARHGGPVRQRSGLLAARRHRHRRR